MELKKEVNFFHAISPQLIELISEKFKKSKVIKIKSPEKNSLNIASEGDLEAESLIINMIKEHFPQDNIIAEENFSDINFSKGGRYWIIDPICGSANFKHEIRNFATNIALVEDGKLIAACVIDHAQKEYIWSTGNKRLFINYDEITPEKKSNGRIIELDLSGLVDIDRKKIIKQIALVKNLLLNKNYYLSSMSTSLSFAYVSLGRISAIVNQDCKIWDMAAAAFLIQEAGGIITDISGQPWTIDSTSLLASLDPTLHDELLNYLLP